MLRVNRSYLLALGVILAALFTVRIYLADTQPELGERILVVGFCAALFVLGLLAWRGARQSGYDAVAAETERLRNAGQLVTQPYAIRRAFRIAESAVEGPHYFLETNDGRVLYLAGQYLYQEDGAELFPSPSIILERHAEHGYVVDLVCEGERLPLEADLPAAPRAWEGLEDGQWLEGTFDEQLAACRRTHQQSAAES